MTMRALLLSVLTLLAIDCRADPGISDSAIVLGMSAPFSGPSGSNGLDLKDGVEVYFHHTNDNGGVLGRKIQLVALDDGEEARRAAANTKKLLDESNVFALMAYYGTEATEAAVPIFTAARTPLIGTTSGASSLREPSNRYLFHLRASQRDELEAIVTQLDYLSSNEVAVLHRNDALGKIDMKEATVPVFKFQMKLGTVAEVVPNSTNVSKAVQDIAATNPPAVIMLAPYKTSAEFVRQMRQAGRYPQLTAPSSIGTDLLLKELGQDARGIGISQVVPRPWKVTLPLVKQYQALMQQYSKRPISYYGLEGFMTAKLAVAALKRAGKTPTREALIGALENEYDLGGYWLNFSAKNRNGSKFTDMTVVGKDGKIVR